jgi:ATP-binding protein involved in chromosome partitioning
MASRRDVEIGDGFRRGNGVGCGQLESARLLRKLPQSPGVSLVAKCGTLRIRKRQVRIVGAFPAGADAINPFGKERDMSMPGMAARKIVLPGVSYTLAVASGKGGVGKSTVAVNLALALRQKGKRVGLLDADIYGPSVPMMLGLGTVDPRLATFPLEKFGMKVMSMGFLVPPDRAVIWRGPMVHKAVEQFLSDIDWGELDFLVVDLPPGTGDAQLTLTQSAPLTGAIIVTTPQDVSLIDARKGLRMFQEVRVPVLGIVENMSYFICPKCGERWEIFRHGGGQRCAAELGVPFLGAIPIDPTVAVQGDSGVPIVESHPDSEVARVYHELADRVIAAAASAKEQESPLPSL